MSMVNLSYTAVGNIRPSRFVTQTTDGPLTIAEVSATTNRIVGIMQSGKRNAPGTPAEIAFAAIAGDTQFRVYGDYEICLLTVAENVSAGDILKSDTQGRGVKVDLASATPQNIGARALQNCANGGLCKVRVQISAAPTEVA